MTETREFEIDADHPALAGHFPGDPLVPGSLILDLVIAALPLLQGQALHLESVKFLAPLRPLQRVTVEYQEATPGHFSISCQADGDLLCKARIGLAGIP